MTDNGALVRAIERLDGAFGEELEARLRAALELLPGATLYTSGEDGPSEVESEDGEVMLALFTDATELSFFDPGRPTATISAADAIGLVLADDYDGLVINPGRRQFDLTAEDIRDFFEVDG